MLRALSLTRNQIKKSSHCNEPFIYTWVKDRIVPIAVIGYSRSMAIPHLIQQTYSP
jgi:hypothetical protein